MTTYKKKLKQVLGAVIIYSDNVLRDSLGMSLRQRLSGHRVLPMNVISLRASQSGAGGIRHNGYSTLVGLVADTRQFRLYRDARERLIPLLLIMLRCLMQINRRLSHLRRVSKHKRTIQNYMFLRQI